MPPGYARRRLRVLHFQTNQGGQMSMSALRFSRNRVGVPIHKTDQNARQHQHKCRAGAGCADCVRCLVVCQDRRYHNAFPEFQGHVPSDDQANCRWAQNVLHLPQTDHRAYAHAQSDGPNSYPRHHQRRCQQNSYHSPKTIRAFQPFRPT